MKECIEIAYKCMTKHQILRIIPFLFALLLTTACTERVEHATEAGCLPPIYPDYIGVTIPAELAPLNFDVMMKGCRKVDVTIKGSKGGSLHTQGVFAHFDPKEWHALTAQNRGGTLHVEVCAKGERWTRFEPFEILVSCDPLPDYGLTYRRIQPGYEVGGNISICQRELGSYREVKLMSETALPGRCFNCHTANRTNPSQLTLQVRGALGGTLVQKEGVQRWYDTRTPETKAAGSYAYWHPEGRYCAYATNSVHQSFFVRPEGRIEVYHKFSDIVVLDTERDELLRPGLLSTEWLEIFPAFAADGHRIYFSTSAPCNVPVEYEQVKCSLCAIDFDAATGRFGQQVDTLLHGLKDNCSYVLARPSYDGRWLMLCKADRGNFPVCRETSDLCILDLQRGIVRSMDEVNSPTSESYHNWSSNSRWFVFSSKRENGLQSWVYLAHIDDEGRASKPLLLPQRRPLLYYNKEADSFNCPDFTLTPVALDQRKAFDEFFYGERRQVKVKNQ